MNRHIILLSFFFLLLLPVQAQDNNLLEQLQTETKSDWLPITSTFKAVRLINGHTVENRKKGNLDFTSLW